METELDNDYKFIVDAVWAKLGKPHSDVKVAHHMYLGWNDNGWQRSRINVWFGERIVESYFIMLKNDEAIVNIDDKDTRLKVQLPKKNNLSPEHQLS